MSARSGLIPQRLGVFLALLLLFAWIAAPIALTIYLAPTEQDFLQGGDAR